MIRASTRDSPHDIGKPRASGDDPRLTEMNRARVR